MTSVILRFITCACVVWICAWMTEAIPTIEVKGSKFFTSDGDQFYIKGVAYQSSAVESNNLVNGAQCKIDADLIQQLGANVVRVYSVDPTLNHDVCMQAFADKGIYVIVDMSTPSFSINRADPKWTKDLRNAFAQVVDGFQKYDNLLGFFASNEIVNDKGATTSAAIYAKAVIADMKAYRDLMQYRKIPIGYSAAYVDVLRKTQQDYFDCGDASIAADFYGFNEYSWCGSSSFEKAGYDDVYSEAAGYDIPILFSETGCIAGTDNRTFDDQIALLGRQMNDRYSGSIIYQWSMDPAGFGLASFKGSVATGTPTLMRDYTALKKQWSTLTPAGVKKGDYNPSLTKRSCPAFTSSTWLVRADATIPTVGMAGFTTPTGPRTTSTPSSTGSGSASSPTGGSARAGNTGATSPSGLSAGAIAGAVLGGLILAGLILGAILFFLRRKKKQRASAVASGDVPQNPDSDKMVVGPDEGKHSPDYYGPRYHELTGNGLVQELDRERGDAAPFRANEMPSAPGRTEELPHGNDVHEAVVGVPISHSPQSERQEQTPMEPSPHVQAQRRRELDWLESEEARLRERREILMRQNQERGSGVT